MSVKEFGSEATPLFARPRDFIGELSKQSRNYCSYDKVISKQNAAAIALQFDFRRLLLRPFPCQECGYELLLLLLREGVAVVIRRSLQNNHFITRMRKLTVIVAQGFSQLRPPKHSREDFLVIFGRTVFLILLFATGALTPGVDDMAEIFERLCDLLLFGS